MFSLKLPHRGDSNEYTQYTIFHIKQSFTLNYPKSVAMCFFQGTQERIRNCRGKRVISVRATEVLLYAVISANRSLFDLNLHKQFFMFSVPKIRL